MKIFNHISLLVFLCLASISNSEQVSVVCENEMKINGEINLKIQDFKFAENYMIFQQIPHIRGEIIIANSSAKPQIFSTEILKMIYGHGLIQRAYFRTIASHVIDGPGVQLNSNQIYKLSIYWPVNMPIGDNIGKFKLVCDDNKIIVNKTK